MWTKEMTRICEINMYNLCKIKKTYPRFQIVRKTNIVCPIDSDISKNSLSLPSSRSPRSIYSVFCDTCKK